MNNKPLISNASSMCSNVFEELLKPVTSFVQQQDASYKHHHNEKLSYNQFFKLLMYFYATQCDSLKLFINTYLNKGLLSPQLNLQPVPYSTMSEGFERFGSDKFQAVVVFYEKFLVYRQ